MRSIEMKEGRVFVLRLEEGEILHEAVESFCVRENIRNATVIAVGAIDAGSDYIAGPRATKFRWWSPSDRAERKARSKPGAVIDEKIIPFYRTAQYPADLTGTGTVFPDDTGAPILHMHGTFGNGGLVRAGCFRVRMIAWITMEVVIRELVGEGPVRRATDPRIDAKLLEIE